MSVPAARKKRSADVPPERSTNARVPRLPICQAIGDKRRELYERWAEEHPATKPGQEPPNRYTQEAVAKRVPVSIKTYRGWERNQEPSFRRLRQIANAMGLDPDYFLPEPEPEPDEEARLLRQDLADLTAAINRLHETLVERLGPPPSRRSRS